MAKDRAEPKKEKKEKKKEKRSEENGVSKHKSKKEKSHKSRSDSKSHTDDAGATTALLSALEDQKPGSVKVDEDGDVIVEVKGRKKNVKAEDDDEDDEKRINIKKQVLVGAMVPFANPLADEKTMKRVLRGVKRSAKHKALKRGVKEVVKALRKSPMPSSSSKSADSTPPAIVVLAADISPADVISHIPVLCEDHNVPYIYVPSRAELGAAGSTKRPTSVVMVTPNGGKKKDKDDEGDKEDWSEIYADLAKVVEKAGRGVKV